MLESQEIPTPVEKPIPPILDLRNMDAFDKSIFRPEILIPSEQLAASQWKTLSGETNKDGVERGLFISADKKGNLHFSKIYKGTAEKNIDGKVSEDNRPSFDMSPISRDFTRLLHPSELLQKDRVIVHTHPEGYPTFSGHDICAYSQKDGPAKDTNGFVMINNLGIHLLIGSHTDADLTILEKKYQGIKLEKIEDIQKIKKMAELAKEFEIGYYFHPGIEESTPHVLFKKAIDL